MPGTATAPTMTANELSHHIIKAALKVHSALGPGLLEKAYRVCLSHELRKNGFRVQTEVEMPLIYDGVKMETVYRIDMLVNDLVILELKSVEELSRIHLAQTLSYLKLSKKTIGFDHQFQCFALEGRYQASC